MELLFSKAFAGFGFGWLFDPVVEFFVVDHELSAKCERFFDTFLRDVDVFFVNLVSHPVTVEVPGDFESGPDTAEGIEHHIAFVRIPPDKSVRYFFRKRAGVIELFGRDGGDVPDVVRDVLRGDRIELDAMMFLLFFASFVKYLIRAGFFEKKNIFGHDVRIEIPREGIACCTGETLDSSGAFRPDDILMKPPPEFFHERDEMKREWSVDAIVDHRSDYYGTDGAFFMDAHNF